VLGCGGEGNAHPGQGPGGRLSALAHEPRSRMEEDVIRTSAQHHDGRRLLTRELPAVTANGVRHPETPQQELVSVCVCTNQTVVRVGLMTMLDSPDVSVAVDAEPHNGDVDVVLFDVTLLDEEPDMAERWLAATTATVLAVDTMSRPDLSARARAAGIRWGITLAISRSELHEVVHGVAAGTLGSNAVTSRWTQETYAGEAAGLSPREAEVLRLIASGLPNPAIAERLSVSINSVKTYIRASYRKIDVTSRSQAVAWAMRHGLGTTAPETTGDPTARGRHGPPWS
jgi:DNA-binding NarL/FixJ family response regulator